jgi:hypothetical protein
VNLMTLPPGGWSSQRHWHSHEDEFVYLLEGELVLVEDGGETPLLAGDCAAFPKGTGNGHHLINRSCAMAVYLEVGSRNPLDLTTCSDVDMTNSNADGRFVHKDGRPYPSLQRCSGLVSGESRCVALSGTTTSHPRAAARQWRRPVDLSRSRRRRLPMSTIDRYCLSRPAAIQ